MVNYLKSSMLDSYPEWHKHPFYLNKYELHEPQKVISKFFENYDLKGLRILLDEWLWQTVFSEKEEAGFYIRFRAEVTKMLEAVFVYFQDKVLADDNYTTPEDKQEQGLGGGKERYYLDAINRYPLRCLCAIFEFSCDDSIKNVLYNWFLLAISNEHGYEYDEGGSRKDLHVFCRDVQHLVEAAYVLILNSAMTIEKGLLNPRTTHLYLTVDECRNPFTVFESFKNKYTFKHARAELWFLLEAVIGYKGEEKVKLGNVLFDYEMLLSIIESAYIISNQDEEILTIMEKCRTANRIIGMDREL